MSAAADAALAFANDASLPLIRAHLQDVYGDGVFYCHFETADDAKNIDFDKFVYHTGNRVDMCGEYAKGANTMMPNTLIIVVDVVADSERATIVGPQAPVVQKMEFRPISISASPGEVAEHTAEDETALTALITKLKNILAADDATASDRRVYYIDVPAGESDFTCMDDEAFLSMTQFLNNVREISIPSSLIVLQRQHETHDPTKYVILWAKIHPTKDVVCLVDRRPTIDG